MYPRNPSLQSIDPRYMCIWWDRAGIIHNEFLEVGQTVIAEVYSNNDNG